MMDPIANEGTLNSNIAKELIWRRNAPYFYRTLYTQELEWPSLTVEWWVEENPTPSVKAREETSLCYLTYGTHTSGEEKNYLIMAKVYFPNQEYLKKNQNERSLKPSDAIKKNDGTMEDKIIVMHQIEHEGEVNKIKHHPKKTNLIATRTPLGEIHIFDKMKFKSKGKVAYTDQIILAGHETQGYSLEWNPNREGNIIAGSYDGKLTMWDISIKEDNKHKRHPVCYFNYHEKEIEDVNHNRFHDSIFASCDDDGQTVLWDIRNSNQPVFHMKGDSSPLYSVQFSPFNQNIFATAGAEKLIKLWDVRNMSSSLFEYAETTSQQINQLKWSSEDREILWSVAGNNMTMWDLNEGKAKFIHSGHMQQINQMDLHPSEAQSVASVDSNNELHVFQPTLNARC